jgi:hypothetical protein
MIKYLVDELDVNSDYEKETLRQSLCDVLQRICDKNVRIPVLTYGWMKSLRHPMAVAVTAPPLGYLEKMVAAVCLGHDRLTVALMQELPAQVDHPIFGPPLQLATKLGHKAFVNAILDHMSTVLKGKKEPECFLRANSSDSSSTSWINPATPSSMVERAILIALDKNNEDLLSLLVDWYEDQGFISCRSIYHEFMQTAIRRSGLAIVKAVLDDIPYAQRGMNSRVTWSDYETACMYGREDVVRTFFDQGYIIANDKVRAKSPLIVAVSSGQLSIVKVVVEAGADVNHESTWNRGKVLPIMVAIRKQNVDIIHYLLDVGARLPTVTDWPTGQRFRSIYEILRQAKMKEGGV